jgi:hypothetical protein
MCFCKYDYFLRDSCNNIDVRLYYQTAIATLIQFIIASLFILVTQLGSSVVTCFKDSSNCISNLITSVIFFILVSVVFGIVWAIGFFAQERRSRRLAQLLICVEGILGFLALFSVKLNAHSRSISGLIASFGLLVMSGWIISLAFRLMRAKGGRVMARRRPKHPIDPLN